MARHFTYASTEFVEFDIGGASGLTGGGVTFAACVRRSSLAAAATAHTLLCLATSARAVTLEWTIIDTEVFVMNTHGSPSSGPTTNTTDGWAIYSASKTSGTVAPRFHKYVFNTNTWAHSNGGSTIVDGSAPGTGGFVEVCRFDPTSSVEHFDGDVAAMALFPYVMTDSESERLARGLWQMWGPAFLCEFPASDQLTTAQQFGRLAGRQTGITGTTRAAVTDPPGFRYSPTNRRR